MLIKWGALVVDGRGKLGGHVGSQGRGGQVLFTKPRATNPRSSFQSSQRALFTQLSQGWSSLTAAQIRDWNEAVKLFRYTNIFGDLKSLSGKALYQQLNQNLLLSGQSTIDDAPEPEEVEFPIPENSRYNLSLDVINFEVPGTPINFPALIYATPKISAGTSYVKDKLFYMGPNNTVPVDRIQGRGYYQPRFGNITLADNIHIGYRAVNNIGQVSQMWSAKAVIEE